MQEQVFGQIGLGKLQTQIRLFLQEVQSDQGHQSLQSFGDVTLLWPLCSNFRVVTATGVRIFTKIGFQDLDYILNILISNISHRKVVMAEPILDISKQKI